TEIRDEDPEALLFGLADRDDRRAAMELPDVDTWRQHLVASAAIGGGSDPERATPLVLDGPRVYLDRYWRYEQRVAARLQALASSPVDPVPPSAVAAATEAVADGAQRAAINTAVTARLTVLTGGPGTGKTTTVVRVLATLVATMPELAGRIALAAPTGKAAARMGEAIRQHGDADAGQAGLADLPATTLHRLLGFDPRNPSRFRHGRDRPLDVDVVVVDEASMVSLPMMAKLLDALPDTARLLLVGDRDQLVSIDAGAVLADISAAGAACGSDDAPRTALTDRIVELRHNYRFTPTSGIGLVAGRIRDERSAAEVVAAMTPSDPSADAGWHDEAVELAAPDRRGSGLLPRPWFDRIVTHFAALAARAGADDDPGGLLADLGQLGVLAALRRGPGGVDHLNAAVGSEVARTIGRPNRGDGDPRRAFDIGTPVLVTRNDHAQQLFNGDVGIVVRSADQSVVAFPAPDGAVRQVPVARIGHLEPVYALSVHKSQGSQFDRVVVTLGASDSPLLTRELVYTAITRARRHVAVVADADTLHRALERRVQRASGLRALLTSTQPDSVVE
ncbi:MAG: exodeoxyribonuclease V subunit alpha, partial [Nitriliruptoraceae bacterium]